MAEALANKYGADVLSASSAGLAPAITTTPYTRKVLAEKNIILGDHRPKNLSEFDVNKIDILVNMSGQTLHGAKTLTIENWAVPDPYGLDETAYRRVRDDIEMRVMRLILKLRNSSTATSGRP
jgi:protein-tyrosine-phosphatase